eukprot:m.40842 g.40842  ORF g.40842 m.40842 type:complete len:921 (-) comp12783_c0_seq2:89-2851(-)
MLTISTYNTITMAVMKQLLKLLHSDPDAFGEAQMQDAMRELMTGNSTSAQTGALLSALEMTGKGSIGAIIAAAADAMLEYAVPCPLATSDIPVVDIVGTGGDGVDAFNVSTVAGIVMAACGVTVAKHGNRSSSGNIGSADFLEAFGANINLDAAQTASVIDRCGYGFLFAPQFHPAMKHVATARKELGFRTLFNLLGPLTNPARPSRQVIGISNAALGPIFASIFAERANHVQTLIVHSSDGLDEVSPSQPTHVWEVRGSVITAYDVDPTMFGLTPHALSQVCGMSLSERVDALRNLLQGKPSPVRSFVVLNAAVGVYVAGKADSWEAAAQQVQAVLDNGQAEKVADRFVGMTRRFSATTASSSTGGEDILTVISRQRRADVAEAKAVMDLDTLKARVATEAPTQLDFAARLRQSSPLAVMAEVKRASPSKGDIALGIEAGPQALKYAQGGAAAISVLTEPTWFKGTLADLLQVRQALESLGTARPAVLRKDFLIDEYQIYEARLYGADTCLLIVAILSDDELTHLIQVARSLNMEPLVEVRSCSSRAQCKVYVYEYLSATLCVCLIPPFCQPQVANPAEMQRALAAHAKVIGINNRNLRDFTVDSATTTTVIASAQQALDDVLLCALSGISNRVNVQLYRAAGCQAVLVGEALMRATDPASLISSLKGQQPLDPLVKICGLKDVATAEATVRAGADMIGLVFAAKSSRLVTLPQAAAIANAVKQLAPHGTQVDLSAVVATKGDYTARAAALRKICEQRTLVVGVFANQAPEEVIAIADEVGLDIIQLSGTEGLDASKHYPGRVVIKAAHVADGDNAQEMVAKMTDVTDAERAHALLLDTKSGQALGGTGVAFDWEIAAKVQAAGVPIFVAGGLDPSTVQQAVEQVSPLGVDVSSGVETNKAKDLTKIAAFVQAAKCRKY